MSFFRRTRLFVILLGIIILVALIGYSLSGRSNLTTAEEFLLDTVGWGQSLIHKPAEFTANVISNVEDVKNAYQENQILKARLMEYKNLLRENQLLMQENEQLRSALEKTESIRQYEPIQATVIARSPEFWFQQVTLDRGREHGIKKNMAVITGEGMIGKIRSVSPFTSTVQLLTGFDENNRISVTVFSGEESKESGFISGYDRETESLLLNLNSYDAQVEEGDSVISSGLGGVFPPGLVIGTVSEISPGQYGLSQEAKVIPAANMEEIGHVIVVKRETVLPGKNETVTEEED